jgi:hypothetical protein
MNVTDLQFKIPIATAVIVMLDTIRVAEMQQSLILFNSINKSPNGEWKTNVPY